MRWLRFTTRGRTAYGIVEGDTVVEKIQRHFRGLGKDRQDPCVCRREDRSAGLSADVLCAGMNYAKHISEGGKRAR